MIAHIVLCGLGVVQFAPSESGGCVVTSYSVAVVCEGTTVARDSPGQAVPLVPLPSPVYPLALVRSAIPGYVDAKVVIGKDGRVTDVTIVRCTQKEFAEPVLVALRRWQFLELLMPGVKERSGAIVECRIRFLTNVE